MSLFDTLLTLAAQEEGITPEQLTAARQLIQFSQSDTLKNAIMNYRTIAPAIDKIISQVQQKGN